jgi:hypothetical protein
MICFVLLFGFGPKNSFYIFLVFINSNSFYPQKQNKQILKHIKEYLTLFLGVYGIVPLP